MILKKIYMIWYRNIKYFLWKYKKFKLDKGFNYNFIGDEYIWLF